MTWLEIMDVLDKMPRHLLKREAELWHYDDEGNYEVMPVHDVVSPLNDGGSQEDWGPSGDYRLSLQSFEDEHKPKTFIVDVSTIIGQSFVVEADNIDEAKETAYLLTNDRGFYDGRLHDNWMLDASTMWDMTEITQVMEDVVENDGTYNYVTKRLEAKYLEED